jgi:hypothetical protein
MSHLLTRTSSLPGVNRNTISNSPEPTNSHRTRLSVEEAHPVGQHRCPVHPVRGALRSLGLWLPIANTAVTDRNLLLSHGSRDFALAPRCPKIALLRRKA